VGTEWARLKKGEGTSVGAAGSPLWVSVYCQGGGGA